VSHRPPRPPTGGPLDSRGLARRVKSIKVRIGEQTRQGYRAEDLHDPWLRYLPSEPAEAEQPEHEEPPWSEGMDSVPAGGDVPEQLDLADWPVPEQPDEGEHDASF